MKGGGRTLLFLPTGTQYPALLHSRSSAAPPTPGSVKLPEPLTQNPFNTEVTPQQRRSTRPYTKVSFHGENETGGSQRLLGFSLLLILSQQVIKGFTVTFILAHCCFNQLFPHLTALSSSSAELLFLF